MCENVIKEIEELRDEDIEEGTYLTATVIWMENNNIPLTQKNVVRYVPNYILSKIKEEAYDNYLIRPSLNPKVNRGFSNKSFLELFF